MSVGRQCYICWDSDEGLGDGDWVSPCRCTGTIRWVHKACILNWVRSQDVDVCPQCRTPYHLSPTKGCLLLVIEYFVKKIYPWIEEAVSICVVQTTCHVAIITLGYFAFTQVYGWDETFNFVSTFYYVDVFGTLETTSICLLVVSTIPWEYLFLKGLYRLANIPLLRKILPGETIYQLPKTIRRVSSTGTISRSILLPVFARICGNIFFNDVESDLHRVILGGISYLTVKTGVRMYYTHKLLTRLDQVYVSPHIPDVLLPIQNGDEMYKENVHDDAEVSKESDPETN